MDLWIHMMHKQMNIQMPIDTNITYSTYWDNFCGCDRNCITSPNIFIHTFIMEFLSEQKPFLQKFVLWKKHIENPFYNDSLKCELWNIFIKTQRTYNGFAKFARMWKIKHAKIQVDTDLYMNPITVKKGLTMSIYQNGSLYNFTIPNLINICNLSLMNSPDFFCEPSIPKNPYTNIPFSNAILYSIYEAVRYSNYRMSNLLHLYYLCNFDLDLFYYKYEATIRDEYISYFIKTNNSDELYPYVREMLKKITIPNKINIDKNFPQDVLVRIMRPFLKLYLIHSSSLSSTEYRYRVYFELKYKLTKFAEYNPIFGRVIMIKKPSLQFYRPKKTYIISYNTDHIAFNDINIDENINLFETKDESAMIDSSSDDDDDVTEVISTILQPNFILNEQNIAANLFEDSTPNLSDDDMEMDDTDSMS